MSLLPRSLFWRTIVMMALLMIAGHFAWLGIFRMIEREPIAQRITSDLTSIVNLTRSALVAAAPERRLDLLRSLSNEEGLQVFPAEDGETVAPVPDDPAFLPLVAQELRARLGANTQFSESVGGIPGVWVSFQIDDQKYWVHLPRERVKRPDEWLWVSWGIVVLALSILCAALIVAHTNRPLRELTRAAALIGRGRTPPPVTESGPTEIRTLAHAFNQMNNDLQQLDADRALLLAGVSHDLRTPLARIRLGVEMLDEKEAALKTGMVEDIEDMDAIVQQFLDFARISNSSARDEVALTETDLDALVQTTVERYQHQNKPVRIAHIGNVPRLMLRMPAFQRVLTNLIDNALRHANSEVEIATAVADGRVRLSVLDRGAGIPAEQAERMLQPFTRLNTARSTSGSGLGLAIVDRIVRMHRGSVQLLPRAGGGLEVRVELPI